MHEQQPTTNRTLSGARLLALILFAGAAFGAVGDDGANVATRAEGNVANIDNAANTAADDNNQPARRLSGFRLHAADIVDMRGLLVNVANGTNGAGGAFADFRRDAQFRLFSALEDAAGDKAEQMLTNFSAIRSADIRFQSELGGRPEQIGIGLLGSLAGSDSHAIGWQLRAFGGRESSAGGDDSRGGNIGFFARRYIGDVIIGANIFGDYEHNARLGEFFRYGFGADAQNRHFALAANYYAPTESGAKTIIINATTAIAAKTNEGYDINLRANIPDVNFFRLRADYYRYKGGFGGAQDIEGLRYGAELLPLPGLQVGVFYDDDAGEFGGGIAYRHTFAAPLAAPESAGFAPDLFAPVLREHSQRLITASATPPRVNLDIRIVGIVTTAMTTAARTITTTMATGGMVTITRTTMAAITTTTTMTTTPPVTTTMTMTAASVTTTTSMTTTMATRMASVSFTVADTHAGVNVRATSVYKLLVTLPAPDTARPWAYTLTVDLPDALGNPPCPQISSFDACEVRVVESDAPGFAAVGSYSPLDGGEMEWQLTVVEGSEDIISVAMTTHTTMTMMGAVTETTMTMAEEVTETTMTMAGAITETTMNIGGMTTFTTMTIAPITTTTRLTTYATTTITPAPNAAMGDISGGIIGDTSPSSFSRPLLPSFSRDSAGISLPHNSAGISKPKRRFPRLRRENDDTFTGRRAFAEITILKAPKGRPVHSTG